jgi:hypothetical protein
MVDAGSVLQFRLEFDGLPVGRFEGIERKPAPGAVIGGFKSVSGGDSETEVVEFRPGTDMPLRQRPSRGSVRASVAPANPGLAGNEVAAAVDRLTRKPRPATAGTADGLVLTGFELLVDDFPFMKSRTGHRLIREPGRPGRIVLGGPVGWVASWRFTGALESAGGGPVRRGSKATVMLSYDTFRRG